MAAPRTTGIVLYQGITSPFTQSQHKVLSVSDIALTFIVFGAQLTRVPPALAWHLAATAFCFGGVEGFGYRTLSVFKVGEAEALAGI